MLRRRRTAALVAAFAGLGLLVAGAVVAGTRSERRHRTAEDTAPPESGHRAQGRRPARPDDAHGEAAAGAVALGRPDHRCRTPRPASARSSASPIRSRSTTSSTSRSSSRGCTSRSCSPTTRSTATARSSRFRWARPAASTRRWRPHDDTIARSRDGDRRASSRSTARWSTSRTSRAGAASRRLPARIRTSARSSRQRASRLPRASDYSAPDKVVASVKHFAAYGQPEGGREYNTTDMSESRLRNLYLPPFKAAIDAGADTVMCSFNAINGVPGCANQETRDRHPQGRVGLRRLHRERLHRRRRAARLPAEDARHRPLRARRRGRRPAARQPAALNAGTDSEMVSTNIRDFGKQLLAQHRISMARLDDAVRRILRVKFRAGLFDHPYVDQAKAATPAQLRDGRRPRRRAQGAAGKSMVLLKNDDATLPLDPTKNGRRDRPARRRPARHARPVVGHRAATTTRSRVYDGHQGAGPEHDVHRRAARSRTRIRRTTRPPTSAARTPASPARSPRPSAADQVVLALGESRGQSGEAAVAQRDRPARQAAGADRRDQGDRQAVRRRALQRPPADARRTSPPRRRRSSRPGSRASRPATPWPTCCSARSTRAASCPCRSRASSGRSRSTTTTSRPGGRAT